MKKEGIGISKNAKRWMYALTLIILVGLIFFIVQSQSSDQNATAEKETKKIFVKFDDLESEKVENTENVQSETADLEQQDTVKNEQISKEDVEQKKNEETELLESVENGSDDKNNEENLAENAFDNESETTNSNQISDYESNQSDSQNSEQFSEINQGQSEKPKPEQTLDDENEESEEQQPEEEEPEEPSEPEKEVDENASRIEQAVQNGFPVIVVSNEKGKPGDKVVVTATLVNNPGVLGTSVTLSYDDSVMTLVSAKSGEAFSDVLTMSHSKKLESGCVFLWDGENLSDDEIVDGTILTLEFQISESAPAGKAPILLINAEDSTVDRDLQSVELVSENGFITIAE